MSDILFKTDDYVFSYRAAGICIQNDRILLQKPTNDNGFAFPGGHAAFGETNEKTLIWEFKEEIGADILVGELKWVGEIFFPWGEKPCHQICLYYTVVIEDGYTPKEGTFLAQEQLEGRKPNQLSLAMAKCPSRFFMEQMDFLRQKADIYRLPQPPGKISACYHCKIRHPGSCEKNRCLPPGIFHNIDFHPYSARFSRAGRFDMLRTNACRYFPLHRSRRQLIFIHRNPALSQGKVTAALLCDRPCIPQVHMGRAYKSRNEQIRRMSIYLLRCPKLLQDSFIYHGNACSLLISFFPECRILRGNAILSFTFILGYRA